MSKAIAMVSVAGTFFCACMCCLAIMVLFVGQGQNALKGRAATNGKGTGGKLKQKGSKCKVKQAGMEYTRRVQAANKAWVCPTGWTDNGCTWANGAQNGELQCKRPVPGGVGSAGSTGSLQTNLVRSPFYGDERGASVSEILLSNGKYADVSGTKQAYTSWLENEAGGVPTDNATLEAQNKRLETAVFPNAEFLCEPGHWIRQLSLYSKDGWTSNGIHGACYNPASGVEYPLFDGVAKYFPSNPEAVRSKFVKGAEMESGYAFNVNAATGIAGRGLESRTGIQNMFNPLVNTFIGIGSAVGVNGTKLGNYKNFGYVGLTNADKGITTMNVWHEANPKRIRALQFTTPDGKTSPVVGTTAGMTKSTYTCPPGTVAVGMTPKLARDTQNRRNTDLTGLSMTCGNPARTVK